MVLELHVAFFHTVIYLPLGSISGAGPKLGLSGTRALQQ